MFKLPEIQGHMCPRDEPHVIYFSADYDYFDKHGFALQQSINRTVGWIHVHCHIINEGNINHTVLTQLKDQYKFTYTWENVNEQFYIDLPKNKSMMGEGMQIFKTSDINYIARRTYLASVRFIRMAEIFTNPIQKVLQIDCDSILRNGFHPITFEEVTTNIGVMPKPKEQHIFIASALSPGTGNKGIAWRDLFARRLTTAFEKGCYWFVDQVVLRQVMKEWADKGNTYDHIPYNWNSWGIKKNNIFSTGKGNKKEGIRFKQAQLRWLPPHRYNTTLEEIRKAQE
tara:strand:+ start:2600 stop:3451 length:852 start_codon:yes stop_codon:yes gene_type:complete